MAGERIGGPSRADTEAERAIWRRLPHVRPSTMADVVWLNRWLARALENG